MNTLTVLGSGDPFGAGGRGQSCALYQDAQGALLLDCGGGALAALKRHGLDPAQIDAVLISHLHGDHFAGLPFLVLEQRLAKRTRPLVLAGPPDLAARLSKLLDALYEGASKKVLGYPLSFVVLQPGSALTVAGRLVRAFAASHMHPAAGALSLRIGPLAWSGDTAWSPELLSCAEGSVLLLCECTSLEPLADHLSWSEIRTRLPLGARRIVLTHAGAEVRNARAEIEANGVLLSDDGTSIDFEP